MDVRTTVVEVAGVVTGAIVLVVDGGEVEGACGGVKKVHGRGSNNHKKIFYIKG